MTSDGTRVRVLGPVTVTTADGRQVELPGATSRALVAALVTAGGSARSVPGLVDDIWGDEPPQNPRAALQTLVSRLRSSAGAAFVRSDPAGYALAVDGDEIDLGRARRLSSAAAGLDAADPDRLALIDEALDLFDGEAGVDIEPAPVAAAMRDAAAQLYDELATSRTDALLAAGRAGEAATALHALVRARPYDEALHRRLMEALAASGREQDAIAVFAGLRQRLRDDLGTSPGRDLADLHTRLLRAEAPVRPARVRIGLRAESNDLIGRDEDVAAVTALLRRSRLVTVLGAGGLGKTRLAQAVAAASDATAVIVIELASVRDDDDVPPAIAAALGISEATNGARLADALARPDLRLRLLARLGEHPTLLVLDNCEQVIDAVAGWTADALAALPGLRVLATSRTPFAVAAEAVYTLDALAAGSADELGPAVRLFVERARAVRPGAILPLGVVGRLCERLDGLPLAIELAAARIRTMTAEQIEARLEDRFALLTIGDRTAPDRHRTLEAVIAWSWDLLDPDARAALEALSLLPAGFSAGTAADVLIEDRVDDLLDRLAAQSLLVVADDPSAASVRFRLLETVREFGVMRLQTTGREDAAWDAVFGWARGFAAARATRVFDIAVFAEIRTESDNLLFVLRRAMEDGRDPDVVVVFGLLCQSWIVRGSFSDMQAFADPVFDAVARVSDRDVPAEVLITVLVLGAFVLMFRDDPRAARMLARLRMLRHRHPDLPPMQRALADVAIAASRPQLLADRLAVLRGDPDPRVALVGEIVATQVAENDGDVQAGKAAAQRAYGLALQLDEVWLAAMAASSFGQLASQSGQSQLAVEWIERAHEGLARYAAEDELRQQGWLRGGNLVSLGRYDEARAIFRDLVEVRDLSPDGLELASIGWFGLAEVARALGDKAEAADDYIRAVLRFRATDQRNSPWYLMAIAGLVSAATFDGTLAADDLARWAQRLRTRALATQRLRPGFVDRPVLGSVLCGWSAWAISESGMRARGLEALALAEALGARQDLPSLHLAEHIGHAVRSAGAEAVATARSAASALAPEVRVARAIAVLGAPVA